MSNTLTHRAGELALLGLVLRDNALADHPDVTPELCADPDVAGAWRLLLPAIRRSLRPLDSVAAHEVLTIGRHERAGSVLADAMEAASGTLPSLVLPVLQSFARRRRLRTLGDALHLLAEDPAGAEVPVESVVAELTQLDDGTEPETVYPLAAGQLLERTFAREANMPPGLTTGFPLLDDLTGGIGRGELTILAARPSMGKSALAQQIALTLGHTGAHVGVCSPEMSRWQLMERVLSARTGVTMRQLRRAFLTPGQRDQLVEAAAKLPPIWLTDRATITASEIGVLARRHHATEGLDLLVIDHLGFLTDPPLRHETQNLRLGRLTKQLKGLARQLDCALLLVCQLNRGAEGHPPTLADLRDSGELEQDADGVWLLHKEDRCDTTATLYVAKNRQGPQAAVPLTWDGSRTVFAAA